jgi:spore coat polysaccharide biosynthesis protein SpsF (cytidylyltransferase family)
MGKIIQLGKKEKRINVGVIIAARMTSERFPGKHLAMLNGKTVIERVIDNCIKIQPITKVIVAVPDTDDSEPLLEHIAHTYRNKKLVDNFCGSEFNVLERLYTCAKHFNFDVILRVTGDCPYINPKIGSEVLELLLRQKYDYTSNIFPKRTFPKGLDVECFTFDCLEIAYFSWKQEYDTMQIQGTFGPVSQRLAGWSEHVTPWMQTHVDVTRGLVQQKKDMSDINLCVDYPEDIKRIEELIKTPKLVSKTIIIPEKANDD